MYKKMFEIKTTARTIKGINKAIEKDTDIKNWFEDEEEFEQSIKEGFTEVEKYKISLYADEI